MRYGFRFLKQNKYSMAVEKVWLEVSSEEKEVLEKILDDNDIEYDIEEIYE